MRDSIYAICPECNCHITLKLGQSLTVEQLANKFLVNFVCNACGTEIDLDESEEAE